MNSDAATNVDAGACTPSSALQIHFAPMYSAFITDSTTHTFQVPAIVTGGTATATWSASNDAAVSFAADPASGGTMITMLSANPTTTITAQVGAACPTSTATTQLNITSAVEADWALGNARYNNGVPVYPGCIDAKLLPMLADSGVTLPPPPDAGCPEAGPACTGCHGSNPTGGFFSSGVQHTPEQLAGFTDQELVNVFVNGTVYDGGPFSPDYLPYEYWQLFHTWSDISTPAQQKGMVVYLRALAPASEGPGGLDFGGIADAGIVTD